MLTSAGGVFGAAFGWLVCFKILALWLGPEGVGLFAQLRQLLQTLTLGATFGGTNLVVQGLAAREIEIERRQFRQRVSRLIGGAALLMGILMLVAAPQLVALTLSSSDPELVMVMRWLALAFMLNVAATYLTAILNGYRSLGILALVQVSGPFVLVLLLLTGWLGHPVAAKPILTAGFVACFGVSAAVAWFGVRRLAVDGRKIADAVVPGSMQNRNEKGTDLFRFAIATVVSALSSFIAALIIRAWIIEAEGLAFVGLFDAGWTLTFNYMTLFLTACNVVYLPALTAAADTVAQRECILKTSYLVLGGSLIVGYGLAAWPYTVIDLFYSSQFRSASELLVVLTVAIIFRGVSWVYGTLMLATRSLRALVASELLFNIGLLCVVRLVLETQGSLAALGWAFVIPHLLYLAFVIEYVRARNPLMHRIQIWPLLAFGTAPLALWMLLSDASGHALPWPAVLASVPAIAGCYVAYRRVSQ